MRGQALLAIILASAHWPPRFADERWTVRTSAAAPCAGMPLAHSGGWYRSNVGRRPGKPLDYRAFRRREV